MTPNDCRGPASPTANPIVAPGPMSAVDVILPTRNRVTGVLPEISKLDVDQSAFDPVVVTTPLEYVGDVYPPLGTVSEYPRPDLSAHAVTLLPDRVNVVASAASSHIDSPSMSSGEKGLRAGGARGNACVDGRKGGFTLTEIPHLDDR